MTEGSCALRPLPCRPSGARSLGWGCVGAVVGEVADAGGSPRGPSFWQSRGTPGEGCGPKASWLALPAGGRERALIGQPWR